MMLIQALMEIGAKLARPGRLSFLNSILVCCGLAMVSAAAQETGEAGRVRAYRYDQWDVFTEQPLTGNQLAVFSEPRGLSKALMQNIAREMAFSESTFIFPADDAEADFRVRIFGPDREFTFAGHPTIGSAFALARTGLIAPGTAHIVFDEGIGPVTVELEWNGNELDFAWMRDRVPTFGKTLHDINSVAIALGLEAAALKSTLLPLQEVSGGASFLFVPLTSRAAVDRAVLNITAMSEVFEKSELAKQSVFLFSTESADDGATVYGRKLGINGREDPATGSAAGPLGCYLVHHGVVRVKDAGHILIRQGVQMGRPSWLHVQLRLSGTEIVDVRVGGSSTFVGHGTLVLPHE